MLEDRGTALRKVHSQRIMVNIRQQAVDASADTEADQSAYDERLEQLDKANRLLEKHEWEYLNLWNKENIEWQQILKEVDAKIQRAYSDGRAPSRELAVELSDCINAISNLDEEKEKLGITELSTTI